jgi:hypothetical protein
MLKKILDRIKFNIKKYIISQELFHSFDRRIK